MQFYLVPLLVSASVLVLVARGFALEPESEERFASDVTTSRLRDTIAGMDKLFFDAYNSCNLKKMEQLLVEDLEFYHDKTGLQVSRASTLDSIQKNLCREGQDWRPRRELVAGSLQVYPLNHYGAIELGSHRFYVVADGKNERLTGVAKFVHVWQLEGSEWKMSRILSYDHHAPERGDIAQTPRDLYDKLASMDRALFDAFNAGDADRYKTLISDDAEFYHDQGGLTKSRKSIVETLERKFQSDRARGEKMTRELVDGSLKVYPLNNYGAIQTGIHRFYQERAGQQRKPTTIANFIHVWKNTDGQWRIARILSYDHIQRRD